MRVYTSTGIIGRPNRDGLEPDEKLIRLRDYQLEIEMIKSEVKNRSFKSELKRLLGKSTPYFMSLIHNHNEEQFGGFMVKKKLVRIFISEEAAKDLKPTRRND